MKVLQVCTGRAQTLRVAGREVLSAISKAPVAGPVAVGPLGLEGDEQADLTVHGGLAKAVYAYPSEHLAFWQTVRAQAQVAPWGQALPAGALGENLLLQGLLERDLWVGDRLVIRSQGLCPGRQADGPIRLLRQLPGGAGTRHGAGRRRHRTAAGPA